MSLKGQELSSSSNSACKTYGDQGLARLGAASQLLRVPSLVDISRSLSRIAHCPLLSRIPSILHAYHAKTAVNVSYNIQS